MNIATTTTNSSRKAKRRLGDKATEHLRAASQPQSSLSRLVILSLRHPSAPEPQPERKPRAHTLSLRADLLAELARRQPVGQASPPVTRGTGVSPVTGAEGFQPDESPQRLAPAADDWDEIIENKRAEMLAAKVEAQAQAQVEARATELLAAQRDQLATHQAQPQPDALGLLGWTPSMVIVAASSASLCAGLGYGVVTFLRAMILGH